MNRPQHEGIPAPPIFRIALIQMAMLALVVAVVWLVWPGNVAAVFWGGMTEALPRLYFGLYAFRFRGASQIRQIAQSFRRGELGKFVLVAMMFGGLFALDRSIAPAAVFAGYAASWLLGTVLGARWLR